MLTIEVKPNGTVIANASARNISDLAEVSDYFVTWNESAAPEMNIAEDYGKFQITGHRRNQTVWALVAKVVVRVLGAMSGDREGKR